MIWSVQNHFGPIEGQGINLLHSLTDFRGFITWGRPETMSPQYGGGGTPKDNLLNRPYLDPKLCRTFFVKLGNFFLQKLKVR